MSDLYQRLRKDDAALLLLDHQTGLFSLVRDFQPDEFKNNVLALAASAKYFKLPTILTTSFEQGPNGPILPELKAMFPEAPFIPRPGQINAWDNEEFVAAVKATGRKQLIMAGVVIVQALTQDNSDPEGWASIIVVLLLCSGATLFSLGLIAEYLGVALHILVGKPLYLTVDSPTPRPDTMHAPIPAATEKGHHE